MQPSDIKPNVIVQGPIFPERVKVITSIPMGDSIKLIGEGMETGKVHQPVLNEEQIAELEVSSEKVFSIQDTGRCVTQFSDTAAAKLTGKCQQPYQFDRILFQ